MAMRSPHSCASESFCYHVQLSQCRSMWYSHLRQRNTRQAMKLDAFSSSRSGILFNKLRLNASAHLHHRSATFAILPNPVLLISSTLPHPPPHRHHQHHHRKSPRCPLRRAIAVGDEIKPD